MTETTEEKRVKRTASNKKLFLEKYKECAHVGNATKAIGIERTTVYAWAEKDKEFAEAWDKIRRIEVPQMLEDEAKRRAVDGVARPVFQQGRQVGIIQEYSDVLLIFLLKGLRPDKYRERFDQHVSGEITIAALGDMAQKIHDEK